MANDRPRPSKRPNSYQQRFSIARFSATGIGGSRRMMLVMLTAVTLCVLVAGISVALFGFPGSPANQVAATSSSPSATEAQAGQPTPPTASSHATAPQVTSDGIAKSALQWPPRLKHQILRWRAGPGGTALSAVLLQLGNTMQAAGIKLYSTMKTACVGLSSSIKPAQAGPPIPDAAMQRLYTKTLTRLSSTAVRCQDAISEHPEGEEDLVTHENKILLNQALSEFASESKNLYKATAQIQALRNG